MVRHFTSSYFCNSLLISPLELSFLSYFSIYLLLLFEYILKGAGLILSSRYSSILLTVLRYMIFLGNSLDNILTKLGIVLLFVKAVFRHMLYKENDLWAWNHIMHILINFLIYKNLFKRLNLLYFFTLRKV